MVNNLDIFHCFKNKEYIVDNALAPYKSNLGWQKLVLDNLFLSICQYLSDTSMLVTLAIKI